MTSSLNEFLREITLSFQVVESAYPTFVKLQKMVFEETCIWPDQYRKIWTLLKTIEEPVQQLYTLLEDASTVPEEIVAHRYLLLMIIQNAKTQVKELLPLTGRFINRNVSSAEQQQKWQQAMRYHFAALKRQYADMLVHYHTFTEQIIELQTEKHDPLFSLNQRDSLLLRTARSYEKMGKMASEAGQVEDACECFARANALKKEAAKGAEMILSLTLSWAQRGQLLAQILFYLCHLPTVPRHAGGIEIVQEIASRLFSFCTDESGDDAFPLSRKEGQVLTNVLMTLKPVYEQCLNSEMSMSALEHLSTCQMLLVEAEQRVVEAFREDDTRGPADEGNGET